MKIKTTLDVDEKILRNINGSENISLYEAFEREIGWLSQSGISMKNYEILDEQEERLLVDTPLGTIKAYKSSDPNYPGIYLMFTPDGEDYEIDLALAEVVLHEEDSTKDFLRMIVWSDINNDDYTHNIKIANKEELDKLKAKLI